MPLKYFGIRVTNLESSIDFYTRLLGLKLKTTGKMEHGGVFAELEDPVTHFVLELNWYPRGSPFDTPYTPGEGLDHLGFEVDDALAVFKRLLAEGVEPALHPFVDNGWVLAFVKDPDGNWIELASKAS
jgi:lactoylglutathione lyase